MLEYFKEDLPPPSALCSCKIGKRRSPYRHGATNSRTVGYKSSLAQCQLVKAWWSKTLTKGPFYFHCSDFNAVFTNLGASGRLGPTSLGSHYTAQDHDGQVTLSSGIQQWTVLHSGKYQIEAIGAAGGYLRSDDYRGRGARMIGTFN